MALVSCPECKRTLSDRATVCPSCGYPMKAEAMPIPATPHTQAETLDRDRVTHRQWTPSLEGQIKNPGNKDEDEPGPIGLARYVAGILLNLFFGGLGWLLAPKGYKRWFFLFTALWVGASFLHGSASTLALGAVNIISAIYFGRRAGKYVNR